MTAVLDEVARNMIDLDEFREGIEQQKVDAFAGLTAILDQLQARRSARLSEVKTLDAMIEDIQSAIPSKSKKKAAASKDPAPSPEAIEQTLRFLAEQPNPMSVAQIHEQSGVPHSSVARRMRIARDLDLVRIKSLGGANGREQFFAVMPNTIERLDKKDIRWPQ